MKTGLVQRALATNFGATPAERVQGGKVGILFVDSADNKLKYIDVDGTEKIAQSGGADVTFA